MTPEAVLVAVGVVALGGWAIAACQFWREGETRATLVALAGVAVMASPFFLALLLPVWGQWAMLALAAAGVLAAGVLLLLPVGRIERGQDVPEVRVDERDIMFARANLEPGTGDYAAYYAMRPEHLTPDTLTRRLPGLLAPEASEYHALAFAATEASFDFTEALREAVDGPVAPERIDAGPDLTAQIKGLACYYGAHAVGVARVEPYHVYTHVGRGSGTYGAPVVLEHPYAIAFTVEMRLEMVGTGPAAPALMESAHQYVEAARVAVQLASFIRRLGYAARAHINGNYRVIAPLVARDAGLGEIGRMGLLMTPDLGPRVRLGVVTTDLPLVPDGRQRDDSVLDFCRNCQKCARCCPVRAIPAGDRVEIEGALRWRIDADVCFRYWNSTGTDCGRCMAVCPYSHPGGLVHTVVRRLVCHSGAARRAAVWLDDAFYGRSPLPRPFPAWLSSTGEPV